MNREGAMDRTDERRDEIPLGQRLFDNWLLLLIAGLLVVGLTYAGWGLLEILTLPQATLP
jgi:hypothetical protein